MDWKEEALLTSISNARYAIAQTLKYQKEGLANFGWVPSAGCGQYFPGETDRLFFYFLDDSYSHLYGSWERIAGYLNIFWPLLAGNKIHFHNYISKLQEEIPRPWPKSFERLSTFQKTDYSRLINQYRKRTIHTEGSQSAYFRQFIRKHADEKALRAIRADRDSRPEDLVACYSRLLEGVREMLESIHSCFR